MERSSQCGITPVNEDECSLSTFNFEDVYQVPVFPSGDYRDFRPAIAPVEIARPDGCSFYLSEISVDSGLGLDGGESVKSARPTIHHWSEYELYDSESSSRPAFPHDSHGKHEFDGHLDTSAGIPISQTYQCDLCDESVPDIFYSFDNLRRHKETRHETTDLVQRISSPAANEGVSKAMNQFQKLSTPPEPSYNSQLSSRLSVSPPQGIALSKGNCSPLGSETTDSGDTEMNVDEESLFDDHDVHLYTERKWDEATIQRLEHIYKQSLYSLVDSQILHRRKGYQVYGTSSRDISVPSSSAATEQSTPIATGGAGVQGTNLQGRDGISSGRKRKADEISDEDDRGDPQDGDGDGSQEPSKRFKPSKSEDRPLRLACPFFKRHPESFRTCGMSDHENSSRVKQHISRKHRMPIYCPRCSETFKTEHERDTHVRDADCPVGPKANFICATAEQLRNLSRRNTHQTDRENWNAIYKILFPDDPLPDSPYLDPLVSYEVNLVREAFLAAAPVAVRTAIQQVIPEEFSDTLQEELERVLRSTHADVFDRILHRMREDCEPGRAHRTTTQSLLQTTVSGTPDSGFGSITRSRSSQDEPEPSANSQDRLTSFGSGSFDLQNDGAMPFLPPLAPEFESSEYHMGYLSQPLPDGAFDDFLEYLDAPGDSFLTDQS